MIVIDCGPRLHTRLNRHVLVLVVEYIIMQYVVIASLFLKEFAVLMHVLVIRVNSCEGTATLIFKN